MRTSEIGQDATHIELPRSLFGGLKKASVEELLNRIAHDYSELELEKKRLLEQVAQLSSPVAQAADAPQDSRKESDELATAVLALAQRAARELRETTRHECELMIRKSRSHALKIERDVERAREIAVAEIDELNAVRSELREHMRSSLHGLLRTFVAERSGELPALDWNDMPGLDIPTGDMTRRKSKKKSKS